MKSKMFLSESVKKKECECYLTEVITEDDQMVYALFTEEELATAIQRALGEYNE